VAPRSSPGRDAQLERGIGQAQAAGEHQDLQQRQVGAEQSRDPADAVEHVPGAVHVQVAAVDPEPNDRGGVGAGNRESASPRK